MDSVHGGAYRFRVAIVDDHDIFVEGLTVLLEDDGRFEVVATADRAAAAAELVELAVPDLLLLDIMMPGGNSLEAIPSLHALKPDLAVVVVSGYDDPQLARLALEAGAAGFVSKAQPAVQLIEALVGAMQVAHHALPFQCAPVARQCAPPPGGSERFPAGERPDA